MKKMSLFSLSWPIFIETLLFMMLGFIDVFALSQYDDLASASVGTANQVAGICNLLFSVTATASAVIIAQNLGAKNREKASQTAALSIFFNFSIGIIVSVVLVIFNRPMLSALGAEGKVLDFGSEYLTIECCFKKPWLYTNPDVYNYCYEYNKYSSRPHIRSWLVWYACSWCNRCCISYNL